MLLRDAVKTFYLVNYKNGKTWEEAKIQLSSHYRDENFLERKVDIIRERKQKPNESITDYTDAMLFLFDQSTEKSSDEKKV